MWLPSSSSDIIAIIGVIVACIAWLWPRAPRKTKGNERPPLPETSTGPNSTQSDLAEAAVDERIEIPFPPGLFIQEYEPNQRLSIRENKPIVIFNPHFIFPTLLFGVMCFVLFIVDVALGLASAVIMSIIFVRKQRSGTFVSINIKKRIYYVCHPSGAWGGGWPPDIAVRVEQDPETVNG
jgi:hypothetical protein